MAGIDLLERDERAQQQPRAAQQQHRDGDLSGGQHASESRASLRRASAVACDGLRERDARRLPRRDETERDRDCQRGRRAEGQHACIERDRHGSGQQPLGNPRRGHQQNCGSDTSAGQPAEHGQHQAFDQHLADDAQTSGAERRAHGQLTRPHRGARQQQVGYVRAAHQQQEPDNAGEQDRRQA